jgi:hypothetical protein
MDIDEPHLLEQKKSATHRINHHMYSQRKK